MGVEWELSMSWVWVERELRGRWVGVERKLSGGREEVEWGLSGSCVRVQWKFKWNSNYHDFEKLFDTKNIEMILHEAAALQEINQLRERGGKYFANLIMRQLTLYWLHVATSWIRKLNWYDMNFEYSLIFPILETELSIGISFPQWRNNVITIMKN